MTGHVKIILVAVPAAFVLTAGATVAVLKKPWGVLKLVETVGSAAESPAAATEPAASPSAPVGPIQPEEAPVSASIIAPAPALLTIGRASDAAVDEQVDYARLNRDVKVVADTLESFNQKLLRMIAQARAAQQREEVAPPLGELPDVEAPPAAQLVEDEET